MKALIGKAARSIAPNLSWIFRLIIILVTVVAVLLNTNYWVEKIDKIARRPETTWTPIVSLPNYAELEQLPPAKSIDMWSSFGIDLWRMPGGIAPAENQVYISDSELMKINLELGKLINEAQKDMVQLDLEKRKLQLVELQHKKEVQEARFQADLDIFRASLTELELKLREKQLLLQYRTIILFGTDLVLLTVGLLVAFGVAELTKNVKYRANGKSVT